MKELKPVFRKKDTSFGNLYIYYNSYAIIVNNLIDLNLLRRFICLEDIIHSECYGPEYHGIEYQSKSEHYYPYGVKEF